LLTLLWLLTGVAVLVAVAALIKARRLARRLERLTESYWELRYEHGQLRAHVNRLDPAAIAPGPAAPATGPEATPLQNFVPLSSLKR
jgi:hypothetical protein